MSWTWSNPSVIGQATKKSTYDALWDNVQAIYSRVIDYTEADQGATGNGHTIKAYVDSIGATKQAALFFPHVSGANTTTYSVGTDQAIPSNIMCVLQPGVILNVALGKTLTINGPVQLPRMKVFEGSGSVSFGLGSVLEVYPQWWGALADGSTDDADAINAAIAASKGLITRLPPSAAEYLVGSSIIVHPGTRLLGCGSGNNQKTRIKLKDNSNDNVIQSSFWVSESDYWHWGEIAHLSIDGNKANQSSGSGIAIYCMGEVANIHHVQIKDCKDAGIHIKGVSAPCRIDYPTINNCDYAGILLAQGGMAVTTINGLSGDDNAALIKITASCDLTLTDLKVEGATDPIIDLNVSSSPCARVNVIGGYSSMDATQTDFIKITRGSSPPKVYIVNHKLASVTNLLRDVTGGDTYTWADHDDYVVFEYGGKHYISKALDDCPLAFHEGYIKWIISSVAKRVLGAGSWGTNLYAAAQNEIRFYDSQATPQVQAGAKNNYLWALNDIRVGGSLSSATLKWTHGSGSPEGSISANPGSLYTDTGGGAGTTLYVKESGTGNTGWVAK